MAETLENFFAACDDVAPAFSAKPWYSKEGDCIHFHWREDEFYREWQDDKLTVYRSIQTNDAVGCQIKGISALLKKFGDFGISLNEQTDVPIAMFLFVYHATANAVDAELIAREKTYKYLLEQVGKAKVDVPEAVAV